MSISVYQSQVNITVDGATKDTKITKALTINILHIPSSPPQARYEYTITSNNIIMRGGVAPSEYRALRRAIHDCAVEQFTFISSQLAARQISQS